MLKKAWSKIFIVNVNLCQFYKYESERNMDIFARKTWEIHKTENIKILQTFFFIYFYFFNKTVGFFFKQNSGIFFVCLFYLKGHEE